MNTKNLPQYAPVVLRFAISAVFMWFGTSQLVNTGAWTGLVPAWATGLIGIEAAQLVRMNGVFEIIMGTLLAAGVFVRWIALILALHLFMITTDLGLTATGVRDFGLAFATLAIALFGEDEFSLNLLQK